MSSATKSNAATRSLPEVLVMRDYYPFGMETQPKAGTVPGQVYVGAEYRYGFNGIGVKKRVEAASDVKGTGDSYDFGARMYDPQVGRWWSRDPMEEKYPYDSPYQFGGNCPELCVDANGMEKTIYLYILPEIRGNFGALIYRMSNDEFEAIRAAVTEMVFEKSKGALQVVHVASGIFVPNNALDPTDTRLWIGGFSTLEAIKQLKDSNGYGPWYQGAYSNGQNRELQGGMTTNQGRGEAAYFFDIAGAKAYGLSYSDKVAYGAVHELIHKYSAILNIMLHADDHGDFRSQSYGDHDDTGWMRNGGPNGTGGTPSGSWKDWDESKYFFLTPARTELLENLGLGYPAKDNVQPNSENYQKLEFQYHDSK